MTTLQTLAFPTQKFNALEVHPCREYEKGTPKAFVEQCEPDEAEFWSVYVHYVAGGLECIADCDTEDEAKRLVVFLENFVSQNQMP